MGDILATALSLVSIIALGYAVKRLGWVRAEHFGILSRIVLRITLPCVIVTSFNDFVIDPALLALPVFAFVAVLVQQVVGFTMERRGTGTDRAFGVVNLGNYNIGLFAMPYLAGFMGSQAVVYAAMFDVGNALAVAGIGYAWAMSLARGEARMSLRGFLTELVKSPPFDAYVVMLLLRAFDLSLPAPVIAFTSTVGAANTFLALFMLGIVLEVRLEHSKYRTATKYLVVRFGLAAVFAVAAWNLLPLDEPIRIVLCTLMFAPLGGLAPVFTGEAGGDVRLSSFIVSVSTLIGVVAMPVVLVLLGG